MDAPTTGPIPLYKRKRGRPAKVKVSEVVAPYRPTAPAISEAWKRAQQVTPQDVAGHVPTMVEIEVGEALLNGQMSVELIASYTGRSSPEIRAVLAEPVAMAWISQAVYAHFQHRAALVDAALIQRALSGDVAAIRLYYERAGKLVDTKNVNIKYSGGLNLAALSLEDLAQIVSDKARTLPADFRVIEEGPGAGVPGEHGAGAQAAPGPLALLPAPAQEPSQAAGVPGGGQEPS